MTGHQILLIQESFKLIEADIETVVGRFYQRLFEINPAVRQMFPADISEQKRKLAATLKLAVAALQNMDGLIPALEQLGRKHVAYGVRDEHYQAVGTALILAIRDYLGEDFLPQTEIAWVELYGIIAETMQRGARQAILPQAA